MQIFKTKLFARWAKDEGLTDQSLVAAVKEMNSGLVDAILGGNVYKKRIAKAGKGKSGSYRTLLAIKFQDKAFFLYGFSKNQRSNVSPKELLALKRLASELFSYNESQIKKAVDICELYEVNENE
jgi:hypothetical protein